MVHGLEPAHRAISSGPWCCPGSQNNPKEACRVYGMALHASCSPCSSLCPKVAKWFSCAAQSWGTCMKLWGHTAYGSSSRAKWHSLVAAIALGPCSVARAAPIPAAPGHTLECEASLWVQSSPWTSPAPLIWPFWAEWIGTPGLICLGIMWWAWYCIILY